MAFGLKCYCCGNDETTIDQFYCEECLNTLKIMFDRGINVLKINNRFDHCVSCGEYKERRILYTAHKDYFSNHQGQGIPVCDKCVEHDLKIINNRI